MTLKRVYLDQNKWIDLSRAATGHPKGPSFADALAVCKFGVQTGLASFPLSSVHYMETLKRRDAKSRHRLAAVMRELSKHHAIAPVSQVLPAELDAALHGRFGKPGVPRPVQVFGVGVWFALGVERERYRVPADQVLPPGVRAQVEALVNDLLEWAAIAGPGEGIPVPGMAENNSYSGFGDRFSDGERRLARLLAQEQVRPQELPHYIHTSEILDIFDDLNEALDRAGITVEESEGMSSAEGLTALLADLPSRAFAVEIRKLRHANPQTIWDRNDLDDFGALAVAVPYCDVVVTERQWVHLIREARLDRRFGTVVLSDVRRLPEALVA
jgi:hypothetical protein